MKVYTQNQRFSPSWIIASGIFTLALVIGNAYEQEALGTWRVLGRIKSAGRK